MQAFGAVILFEAGHRNGSSNMSSTLTDAVIMYSNSPSDPRERVPAAADEGSCSAIEAPIHVVRNDPRSVFHGETGPSAVPLVRVPGAAPVRRGMAPGPSRWPPCRPDRILRPSGPCAGRREDECLRRTPTTGPRRGSTDVTRVLVPRRRPIGSRQRPRASCTRSGSTGRIYSSERGGPMARAMSRGRLVSSHGDLESPPAHAGRISPPCAGRSEARGEDRARSRLPRRGGDEQHHAPARRADRRRLRHRRRRPTSTTSCTPAAWSWTTGETAPGLRHLRQRGHPPRGLRRRQADGPRGDRAARGPRPDGGDPHPLGHHRPRRRTP